MWMIRRFGLLVITALMMGSCVHVPRAERPAKVWHRKPVKAADLTLRQQVAQLITVRVEGYFYSVDNDYRRKVEKWVAEDQVGGLITFRGSVDGTFTNLQHFQSLVPVPLLIASDLERGAGQQVKGATAFPSNMAVAATFNEQNAYEQGRITALEARALGIHVTLAPVMDVNNNPDNPVINFRSYSDDPAMVARMGSAFIRGTQEHGLIAAAKHYPGHGNTDLDSHLSDLPVIPGSRKELEQMELLPFKAATEAGVKMMMVGHLVVPGLDDSHRPAIYSTTITRGVLREELDFQGIIVTDALEMASITTGIWTGESAIRAIEAGNDVILLPLYVTQTIDAIEQAVLNGRISRERIEESANRILTLKADLNLYEKRRTLHREALPEQIGLDEAAKLARKVAQESITLVKDEMDLIPFRPGRGKSLTHLVVSVDDELKDWTAPFWRNVRATYGSKRVKTVFVNYELDPSRIKELVKQAKSTTHTLVTLLVRIYGTKGESTIDSSHHRLLEALRRAQVKSAVVCFGSPYLPSLEPIPAYLCGYGYGDVTMRAMADALFGRTPITGRLPVDLDEDHPRGHGLTREALSTAFSQSMREWDFSRAYAVLDSAIRERITPGAQVFIAREGRILADTAFGRFTYDEEAPLVTTTSIYDLASITKVLVGGTLAMQLVDGRYLVLDEPVQHYIPAFRGEWKERVTIRHLLSHSSGLPPFIQFWKQGIRPDEVLDMVIGTELDFEPGTQYQYSDLGIILFGAIVELVTGERLADLAWNWIFDPLMMESTAYNPPPEWREHIVPTEVDAEGRRGLIHGEVHDGNTWFMGGVSLHAGVFTPANQLAILGMLYLNGGVINGRRLVQEMTIDEFIQPQELPPGSGRALTWWLASSTTHAGDLFSESAIGLPGFTGTSIWIDPETELIVVLLTNRVHPTRERGGIRAVRRAFHNAVVRAVKTGEGLALAGNRTGQ